MSEVTLTQVKFTNIEDVADFTGDFTADELKDMLVELYPFLENSTASESVDEESGIRTIIFSEKMGTKGLLA